MHKTKNIVLVHGAWADGSSWSKVIPKLESEGFHVTAVQLPLTSFSDDVATVKRALALEEGPVLLVGHSYGGAVITEAGNDPKVAGLVYVAAFAPGQGESVGALLKSVPPSPLLAETKPDAQGFLKLTPKGMTEDFAQDLPDAEKKTLLATQAPFAAKSFETQIKSPAWNAKPSFYVVATEDRAIPPELQTRMAKTIKADTISVPTSHVAMLSRPDEVAAHITRAAA
jgi:pimeloyl-ACP methyl ester carboxylesterase